MWIHFNGSEPLRWMSEQLFNVRNCKATIQCPAMFRAEFEHLLECVHRDPENISPNLSLKALGLLSHVLRDTPADDPTGEKVRDKLVNAAKRFIWNYGHGGVDVPMVAEHLHAGRRSLERRFRAATGRSVLEEIQFCRVSRAAVLLRETSIPIKQVVYRAGFRNDQHMRQAFLKLFSQSPQSYRDEHGEHGHHVPENLQPPR